MNKIPELNINGLIVKLPIIQGGMGIGISLSGLSSAVANAGGVGVISTVGIGMFEKDFYKNYVEANDRALRKEIRTAREKSNGVLGANLMVASTNLDNIVNVIAEEGLDVVFIGAGITPTTTTIKKLLDANIKIMAKVSSARVVKIIFTRWARNFNCVPDGVVVEGPLAGGHLGFSREQIDDPNFAIEKLIPEVLDVVKPFEDKYKRKIPVIAAGGIYTGADIHKFIEMGAAGVKMGTRFVATHECDADKKFKDEYINCKEEDIVIINSPVGLPARAIRNKFIDEINSGVRFPIKCPLKCLKTCNFPDTPYCIVLALTKAQRGKFHLGYAFAGSNAAKINKIISVEELMNTLTNEYEITANTNINLSKASLAVS